MAGQIFKNSFSSAIVFACFLTVATTSCITPMQKREMTDDIQALKEHVATLQTALNEGRNHNQQTGEVQQRNLASVSADIERLNQEMKRMKGDIDTLRVGVTMGQLPGQETPAEGSVMARLAEVQARLDAMDARITDIQTATPAKSSSKKGDKTSVNADSDSLHKAFDRKHYNEVIEDAPAVLKKLKGKDREGVLGIYGDSLMKVGKHKEAALQFNEIVESKPSDKAAANAQLKLAECFKAMGDKETSKLFYEELVSKYPDSPEAAKAKKALTPSSHKKK